MGCYSKVLNTVNKQLGLQFLIIFLNADLNALFS